MKEIITISCVLLFCLTTFAQTGFDDDYYYMKCGTKLGKKSELIEACASAIPKEYHEAYREQAKVCACLMKTIAKHYTYKELESLVKIYGSDFSKVIYKDGDLAVVSDLEDCAMTYIDQSFDITKAGESFEEGFMIGCIRELKNNPDLKEVDIDEYVYCDCIKEEIQKRGFSLSQLEEIEDENSVLFNEVFISCLSKPGVMKEESASTNDVVGYSKSDYVPLINYGVAFKVKVKVGNLSKYFIFDSGASDVLISSDFERELLLEGLIRKEDYLTDDYYSLADGSIVKCRRILLDDFEIGDFTVNNVIVAIVDNSDNSLLLGKSFLDKFSNWSIDNKNSTLYLEKK